MKYKQPKFSGGYTNIHYKSSGDSKFASLPKPARIAIIVVAAVLILAILVVGIIAIVRSVNEKKNEEFNKQLKEIQISHLPNKRNYYCGDSFEVNGLTVYSVTNGGDFTQLDLDACTITGFDSSVPVEKQTITVTYKGFTDTFVVEIKAPESATPMLVSIKMGTLPKTVYEFGEIPDVEGGTVICTYSDGSTKTIALKNKHVSGFGEAYDKGPGEHDITVTVTQYGIQAQTTYKITITE